jgi:hypothetical protein
VVDEQSASLPGYKSLGLGLDHFNMNKFLKPNDGYFIMVKNVVQDMVAASAGIMAARGHRKCTKNTLRGFIFLHTSIQSSHFVYVHLLTFVAEIGPKKKNPAVSDASPLPSTQPMAEYRPLSRPPYPTDPRFIPHENILEQIEQKFGNHPRVALYGSSGNG